jgi:hypothetical protein
MVEYYRVFYFWLLKLSTKSEIDFWQRRGCNHFFFYEKKNTPCGNLLIKYIKNENFKVIGGIKYAHVLRGIFIEELNKSEITVYTGNINSICLQGVNNIVEIQHGLLDDSYFKGRIPILFLARSKMSAKIYNIMRPQVPISIVSFDLSPPAIAYFKIKNNCEVHFYSKNPGGGISKEELSKLENCLTKKFPNLILHLHPRDNLIKFLLRFT